MNQSSLGKVKKKNISVTIETFRRLETLKSNLIKERTNPNLTYDEVIKIILDNWRP